MQKPLKNKVIIRPDAETNVTEQGIILTGKQNNRTWQGVVVDSAHEDIEVGVKVIYNKQATTELEDGLVCIDGENDIFAFVY